MFSRSNKDSLERVRQMRETELIAAHFPGVSQIVVSMEYSKKRGPAMQRTLNFSPGNHAFFKLNCLGEGCVGGGLDITGVLTAMIRKHDESAAGSLHCSNSHAGTVHADMSYKVSITYD